MIRCISCFEEYEERLDICPHCGYCEGKEESPHNRLPHGTILNGNYKIGKTLGEGGFGIIYKAWDIKLQTIVAVKEYYPRDIAYRTPGEKEVGIVSHKYMDIYRRGCNRLLGEARHVATMQGRENIVSVRSFFEENNTSYMVMEYLEGVQLKEIVEEIGGLSVEDVMGMFIKLCDALRHSHMHKIIHRDVSPDNIMIDVGNEKIYKLIDFGNARIADIEEPDEIIIKVGFSPIEQYNDAYKEGPWTDIYALGATMYYALTGIIPSESVEREKNDTVIPPHELNSNIPESLSNIVMRAMAVEKHHRYQSIDELKKDMYKDNVPTWKQVVRRKKVCKVASAVSVATLIIVGVVLFVGSFLSKRAEVHLPYDTSISIWIMEDDNGKKEQAFADVIENFERAYEEDKVNIELVAIPEDQYEERIQDAIKSDTLPEIFEQVVYDNKYLEYTQDVSEIVKDIKDNIYFADNIYDIAEDDEMLVYGFDMPVLYVNTTLYEGKLNYNSIIKELKIEDITKHNNLEAFLNNEDELYYGYVSDYEKVLKIYENAGTYGIIKLSGELECRGEVKLSMSEAEEDESEVAQTFLSSMYSDASQDLMFLQTNISKIPVNKTTLEKYDSNTEFTGFFKAIDKWNLEDGR